jgi:hypothetical protein
MNVVARSTTGIVGSNPTRGMDVCVGLFCVCAVLCAGSGLISRPRSPTNYVKDEESEKTAKVQQRAVEP